MEEVLLGVAVDRCKVILNEALKPGGLWFLVGKVQLMQGLEHPGVDGKGLGKAISEEQNAVRDLGSNPR